MQLELSQGIKKPDVEPIAHELSHSSETRTVVGTSIRICKDG